VHLGDLRELPHDNSIVVHSSLAIKFISSFQQVNTVYCLFGISQMSVGVSHDDDGYGLFLVRSVMLRKILSFGLA
jgi:hypothetical protein